MIDFKLNAEQQDTDSEKASDILNHVERSSVAKSPEVVFCFLQLLSNPTWKSGRDLEKGVKDD